jgi:hypothetical protein
MKKIFSTLFLWLSLLSISCKKDNSVVDNSLQEYASNTKLNLISLMGNEAIVSFVENHSQKDIVAQLQYKTSEDKVWKDAVYTDKNNILLSNLQLKTTYHIRVELTRGKVSAYSKIDSFTTPNYWINYSKLYSGPSNLYDKDNGIFSIEGAQHVLYGNGFKNVPEIKLTFSAIDNALNQFSVVANVLNDTMLTFDIPRDLLANSPYVERKIYDCMVGELPLIGFKSFSEQNYLIKGDVHIVNRDLIINNVSIDPMPCKIIGFYGFFGTHELSGVCPPLLYAIATEIKERKVIIRDASGGVINEVSIKPNGTAVCDGQGFAPADFVQVNKPMIAFHEVTYISIKTTLPSGTYTAQIKQTAQDGAVAYSNIFGFSF